jgi:hypothetical protein
MSKRWVTAVFMVALILIVEYVPACFAADASLAGKAIDQAERDLTEAYVNVSEADSAGADVSALLGKLNSAGFYLSEANVSFKAGNYDYAVALAMDCSNAVNGVADEAANLKSYTEEVRDNTIFWAVFVSVLGVLSVVVLGFLGWGFLKRRYFRELLNKRPEVVDVREL